MLDSPVTGGLIIMAKNKFMEDRCMIESVLKTEKYIMENGTKLQKACCEYVTGKGSKENVIAALREYQNADGGFANGLEIEYPGPVSSPFTTVAALGHISKFGLKETDIFEKTIAYLKNSQKEDGSWDDSEKMLEYPHPAYMGPGIYPEYKTGMIVKWLLRLGADEKHMLDKAKIYLNKRFDEITAKNDFWSAVAYSSAFSMLPNEPEYDRIMGWSMKILMPQDGTIGWQQISGMIEDDVPIPESGMRQALELIKQNQEQDGAWPHPFGTYNRVWSAIFILRFLLKRGEI